MRLNKDLQYAILVVAYICRSGRASTHGMAEGLVIPHAYLQQIAYKLKKVGILKSIRGPGGGFELVGDPTVKQVFAAFTPIEDVRAAWSYPKTHEGRTLAHLVESLHFAWKPIMNTKIRTLGFAVVNKDNQRFSQNSPSVRTN